MVPVGGATHRQVNPWVFWGGFVACLLVIVGAWALTLPIQWAAAEVPPSDPPRWSLLDAGVPVGRLKSQMNEVQKRVEESKKMIVEMPENIQQAEKFRAAGQAITTQLESQSVVTTPTPTTDSAPATDPAPILVTPPLTTKP